MEVNSLIQPNGIYTPKLVGSMPSIPGEIGNEVDIEEADYKEVKALDTNAKKEVEKESEQKSPKELKISEEDIQRTIASVNKKIEPLFLEFRYKLHTKTNTLMISVVNTSSKEVLREIPPEKALDALAKMWELAGILVDKKG